MIRVKEKLIPSEYENLIFTFRGKKVMVDMDLGLLYGVQTKRLKEQVKRNNGRFPSDFMFELVENERDELVANCDRLSNIKHSSVLPMAFTEQGVTMLSSILRSEKAIEINIQIMRAFVRYRSILNEHKLLRIDIEKLDQKIDEAFQFLLERIDELHETNVNARTINPIGFRR